MPILADSIALPSSSMAEPFDDTSQIMFLPFSALGGSKTRSIARLGNGPAPPPAGGSGSLPLRDAGDEIVREFLERVGIVRIEFSAEGADPAFMAARDMSNFVVKWPVGLRTPTTVTVYCSTVVRGAWAGSGALSRPPGAAFVGRFPGRRRAHRRHLISLSRRSQRPAGGPAADEACRDATSARHKTTAVPPAKSSFAARPLSGAWLRASSKRTWSRRSSTFLRAMATAEDKPAPAERGPGRAIAARNRWGARRIERTQSSQACSHSTRSLCQAYQASGWHQNSAAARRPIKLVPHVKPRDVGQLVEQDQSPGRFRPFPRLGGKQNHRSQDSPSERNQRVAALPQLDAPTNRQLTAKPLEQQSPVGVPHQGRFPPPPFVQEHDPPARGVKSPRIRRPTAAAPRPEGPGRTAACTWVSCASSAPGADVPAIACAGPVSGRSPRARFTIGRHCSGRIGRRPQNGILSEGRICRIGAGACRRGSLHRRQHWQSPSRQTPREAGEQNQAAQRHGPQPMADGRRRAAQDNVDQGRQTQENRSLHHNVRDHERRAVGEDGFEKLVRHVTSLSDGLRR